MSVQSYWFALVGAAAVAVVGAALSTPVLGISVAAGALLMIALFTNPKIWLALVLVSLPAFFVDSGKGLSVSEAVVGGFLILSIIVWTGWQLAIDYRQVIQTWPDAALILFLLLSASNAAIAISNDIDFVSWLSEWLLLFLLLYYLPLRKYFGQTEQGRSQVLVLLSISACLQALVSMWLFKQRMGESVLYAYQLESSRSVLLGPMFLVVIIGCLVGFFHSKSYRAKLGIVITGVLNAAALFLTFTRTLWLLAVISIAIVFFFLSFRQRVSTVVSVVGSVVLMLSLAYAFAPSLTDVVGTLLRRRIASSTQLKGGDYSFETRVIEASTAWRRAQESPLGGQGIRYVLVSWHPVHQWTSMTTFIHNGYVGLIMKLGIPMAAFLVAIVVSFFLTPMLDIARNRNYLLANPMLRVIGITTLAYAPVMLVVIFMSGVFDQRYGVILLALLFAGSSVLRCAVRTNTSSVTPVQPFHEIAVT